LNLAETVSLFTLIYPRMCVLSLDVVWVPLVWMIIAAVDVGQGGGEILDVSLSFLGSLQVLHLLKGLLPSQFVLPLVGSFPRRLACNKALCVW